MNQCGICGVTATRSCTQCCKFCCEGHIRRFHVLKGAGVVCKDCASKSWILAWVGLVIFAVIALVVYFSVIKP